MFRLGAYLYNDEFSIDEETHQKVFSPVHIHFDFVYVAHLGKSLKTGMELQCSMRGSLEKMGFVTAKGKGAAQQQLEQDRTDLDKNIEFFNQKSEQLEKEIQANTDKSLDLFYKEIQLSEKQKELDAQKNEIDQKSKNLELEQNDLERDKSLFKTKTQKVVAYNQIWDEVERNGMGIDSEISAFNNNRFEGFTSRFNKFVGNVKKIVTAITTELNWYKAAFKDFWHKTPKDFRNLADEMDRNKCGNFSDYNKKFYNGELDYQIQEKNQIQQKHTIHQKKINDDYEWDR